VRIRVSWPRSSVGSLRPLEGGQELTDLTITDERVAKGKLGLHLVAVAAAMSLTQHIALLDQLGENFVSGPLGDPDRGCNITQSDTGILRNAEQNVGVIGEEIPTGNFPRHPVDPGQLPMSIISRTRIHESMIHSIH
jgi:hypothetical protein